jgi:hypothetical protein
MEPDADLTYSDSLILAGIQEGRREAEIAVQLGLSVGHVKARVARLTARPVQPRSTSAPAEPVGEVAASPGAAPGRTFVVTAGVLALFSVAAGFWWWRSSLSEPAPVGSLQPGAAAESAPARPVDLAPLPEGAELVPMTLATPGSFPRGLMLYTLTGCIRCGAHPESLVRAYRDRDNDLRVETLFSSTSAGGPLSIVWLAQDASDIVIGVCEEQPCASPLPFISEETVAGGSSRRTRFFRSQDGGVTFRDIGVVEGLALDARGSAAGVGVTVLTRAGSQVVALDSAGEAPPPQPVTSTPRSTRERNAIRFFVSGDVRGFRGMLDNASSERLAVMWFPESSPEPRTDDVVTRIGVTDSGGVFARVLQHTGGFIDLGAWLDEATFVVTVEMDLGATFRASGIRQIALPATVNHATGEARPIAEPYASPAFNEGSNRVMAALAGSLIRVPGPHCLEVLAGIGDWGAPLTCVPAGGVVSLLGTKHETGEDWIRVRAPGGQAGWALANRIGLPGDP